MEGSILESRDLFHGGSIHFLLPQDLPPGWIVVDGSELDPWLLRIGMADPVTQVIKNGWMLQLSPDDDPRVGIETSRFTNLPKEARPYLQLPKVNYFGQV